VLDEGPEQARIGVTDGEIAIQESSDFAHARDYLR
jgi:hypothetical protein